MCKRGNGQFTYISPLQFLKAPHFTFKYVVQFGWDIRGSFCLHPMYGHKGYEETGWEGGNDSLLVLFILPFASALELLGGASRGCHLSGFLPPCLLAFYWARARVTGWGMPCFWHGIFQTGSEAMGDAFESRQGHCRCIYSCLCHESFPWILNQIHTFYVSTYIPV